MAGMSGAKKTKERAVRAHAFAPLLARELKGVMIAAGATSALTVISPLLGRAAFIVCAVIAAVTIAAFAVVRVLADASDNNSALAAIDKKTRVLVTASEVAGAKTVAVLVESAVFGLAVAAGALILGAGASAAAIGAAAFGAAAYMTMLLSCVAAKHSRRRQFIFGTVWLYTVGMLALCFVLLCLSRVPLGGDVSDGKLPAGTLSSLALIYALACALRIIYLFFILRRRLRVRMKLK